MLPGVRAVFFDAVGTLLHPEPAAPVVYAAAAARHGSRLDAAVIGQRFRAAFRDEEETDRRNGWRTDEQREVRRWRQVVGRVLDDVHDPEGCFRELFQHFARPDAWRCDPDAAVLRELAARGLVLGLASNYDERLRSVLAGKPELRHLEHVVISAEVGWRKPAAGFFAAVCAAAGMAPEQIVLVGDDLGNDYEGARAAGLRAVLFDPRGRHPDVTGPRVSRLAELPGLLQQ